MFGLEELTLWTLCELSRLLNNLKRWSSDITESGRNELGKQALNVIFCYILATEYEARTGKKLRWYLFPRIAIYRAFQKAFVNFDIKEMTLHEIEGSENAQKMFNSVTEGVIEFEMDEEFCSWIKEGCDTLEEQIYKAATKIATLIELLEIKNKVNNFEKTYYEIIEESQKYNYLPGFKEIFKKVRRMKWKFYKSKQKGITKVLRDISTLKNRDRWSVYSHTVKCSVLGHLFDTAIIAFFVSLKRGLSEEDATKNFFIGIFHDVPEAYTGDIPSPVKDHIKGFRTRSEEFERRMMDENFYPYVPSYVEEAIRDVMLEEPKNADRRNIGKIADYISAVSELHRQAIKGCHDREHYKALVGHRGKLRSYGADEEELRYFDQVEKYCRKIMLTDEVDYLMANAEMLCRNIKRVSTGFMKKEKKYKTIKKLYREFLVIGYYLEKSEADEFNKKKYAVLKKKCRNYFV